MKMWELSREGFIMQYMVAGPVETDYHSELRARDQMSLEGLMRAEVAAEKPQHWQPEVSTAITAECGLPWRIYAPYGNYFIDESKFYSVLKRIRLDAAAVLYAEAACEVRVKIWTYMSVGLYLNGTLAGEHHLPCYKPMGSCELKLSLRAGRNELLLRCDNLGVRDTRNIVGLQVLDHREQLRVALWEENLQMSAYEATAFLEAVHPEGDELCLPRAAGESVTLRCLNESPDFYAPDKGGRALDCQGLSRVRIPDDVRSVRVSVAGEDFCLERNIEFAQRHQPQYLEDEYVDKRIAIRKTMERIAAVKSLDRGEFGFSIMNILARKHLNCPLPEDRQLMLDDLALIEKRVDCADFLICGLIRYIKVYGLGDDAELAEKLRHALLNFRYWMNMPGSDAMCFWSENHSMMFYACAMFAGQLYPDDEFPRAGMKGTALAAYGRGKLLEWLEDIEAYGFEEFLSAVYMCVSFAALLNLVDFADEEISRRASKICDRLLTALARHSFHGTVIAPMGRVYRGIIYPFENAIEAMIHLIDAHAPYCFGEGWMAYLAGSRYHFPEQLTAYLNEDTELSYAEGNALICLKKTQDYCLSSVQSPRTDGWQRWTNLRLADANMETQAIDTEARMGRSCAIDAEARVDRSCAIDTEARMDRSHAYTKSLNESFHGTSLFEPGTFGYQQHLWMAALSPEAVLFVNHPGTSAEKSGMRPGYWYGNGVMPALRQQGRMLSAIYCVPDSHPIHFTHVYFPKQRYDEVREEEQWLFARKGASYLALWTSGRYEDYSDMIFDCEKRVYGASTAYVCLLGSEREDGGFEQFIEMARKINPVYDKERIKLESSAGTLSYTPGSDRTQFVE